MMDFLLNGLIFVGTVGFVLIVVACFVEGVITAMYEKNIKAIVKYHFGDPLTMGTELVKLRADLAVQKKAAEMRLREIERLKETLEIWKEGVDKGCTAEAIEEQIQWKREQGE